MKNKEIEEILEGIKVVIKHNGTLEFDVKELKILLSHIEQLQTTANKCKQLEINRNKAIEYIKMHSNALGVLDTIKNYTLLNILKGDSDENRNV
jgi:hypothetical protein